MISIYIAVKGSSLPVLFDPRHQQTLALLVRYCQFDVSSVNYSDSDSDMSGPPSTLLSLTAWNGVNMLLKFLVKQLRHWVFFSAVWLLHPGIQRKLHTKHLFVLGLSMHLLFGIPIMKLRQKDGKSAEDGGQVDLHAMEKH